MRHGLFKRSLSMVLALVMILGNLPLNALATENEETTAPACAHSYEAEVTDATCTEGGYTTHTCSLCGDSYVSDETAAKGHSSSEGEVTLPTCTEGGYTTYLCGACEVTYTAEETEAKGHAWGNWAVTTAATVEAEGQETRVCEKCGAEENRTVAKLEPAPVEDTTEPTEDLAVAAVQEMIDALPTSVNSEEEAEALEDAIAAVDDALAELYTEQSNQLDYTNYVAALEALEEAFNTDWSKGELTYSWEDNNAYLDIKDGTLSSGEFYNALKALFKQEPASGGSGYTAWGGNYKFDTSNHDSDGYKGASTWLVKGEDVTNTDAETPAEGKNYAVRRTSASQYSASENFTVRYYYEVTVDTNHNDGAVVYNGTEYGDGESFRYYYKDTTKKITAKTVEGYEPSFSEPSASGTLTVNYISTETATKYDVSLVINGGDFGDASLDKNGELAEGTVVTLSAESNTSSVSHIAYYIDSVSVNGAELTSNNQFTVGNSDVIVTVTFAKVELNASSSSIEMNGYYEGRASENVFDTLKTDILTAAGLTGANAADYTVEVQAGDNYYNLDTITDWQHALEKVAFFAAVEVPETGRKFIITKNESGNVPVVSATVTMDITESRTAPDISAQTITVTADTQDDFITAVKTEVDKRLGNSNMTTEVTIKDDVPYTGSGDYTVLVKVTNEGETWVASTTATEVPVAASVNKYTVEFVDDDKKEISSKEYDYGTAAADIVKPADPTKAATAQYTYTFSGWTPDIAQVTADATYTATYSSKVNEYTITWNSGEGKFANDETVLTAAVKYGDSVPTCAQIPARESTDPTVQYTHSGWIVIDGQEGENNTVVGNLTYQATYSTEVYTAIAVSVDGQTVKTFYVGEGEGIAVNGGTITHTKSDNSTETYTVIDNNTDNRLFVEWNIENNTYTAQWTADVNNNGVADESETAEITVTVDGNGTVVLTAAEGANLTKTAENTYTLLFNSNVESTKTVTVEAKPNDTVATDGGVDYVVSCPETITVQDGTNTISAKFGTRTLDAKTENEGIKLNKYYAALSNSAAIATLRTDILKALDLDPNGAYVVTTTAGIQSLNITATVQVVDGKATVVSNSPYTNGLDVSGVLANELSKDSYSFTITLPAEGDLPEVSQTLSIAIGDSREPAKIALNYKDVGFNTYADFEAAVKNAVTVTDSHNDAVTSFTTKVEATENGTYTATVTATATGNVGGEFWAPNTATFENLTWTVNQYSVEFVDEDGTTLKAAKKYDYGTAADKIEKPADPTKDADAQYTYEFSGWDPAVAEVTGDVTYKATYKATTNEYTITWVIGENSDTTQVAYGKAPTHAAPTAPENSVFAGWKDEKGNLHTGELPAVTGAATYTAEFTADIIFVVTFVVDEETKTEVRYNVTDEPEKGVAAITPADKTDLIFDAWYTDEAYTKLYTFGTVPTGDISLYAKWIPEANDNNVLDEKETVTVTKTGEGKVTVTGADRIGETDNYLFDSTKVSALTITAAPVVTEGVSETYVSSITYKGQPVEMTFDKETFAATAVIELNTAVMQAEAEETGYPTVEVTFEEAGFEFNDSRLLNYYEGMSGVANKDVYNAIVKSPALAKGDEYTIQYKAREAMTQKVSVDSLDLGDGWTANILKTALKNASVPGMLENGYLLFSMDALWLDIDVESNEAFPESVSLEAAINANINSDLVEKLVDAYMENSDFNDVKAELEALRTTVYNAAMYYEAHSFGFNDTASETVTEEIRITYKNTAMYIVGESDITLKDLRAATSIVAEDITVVYNSYTDEDLLARAYVTSNGVKVEGAQITCADLADPYTFEGKNVSDTAYELLFKFKGNENYKPSEAEVSVTVKKAPVQVNADHRRIKFGTAYEMPLTTTPAGVDMIHFIAGLDISDLNVNDKKLVGIMGSVQLLLPEELQSMLTAFDSVLAGRGLNVSFADGASMKLSDLKSASAALKEILQNTQFAAYTDTLVKALESLPTDVADIEIIIGGDLPTNIGAYIIGGITADANYETAVGAAVVVITPEGKKANIDWVNHDENNIFTNSLLTGSYLDAYVVSVAEGNIAEAEEQIIELFLGVNVDGSIVLTRDETALNVGAYAEVALVANWGNEMYYSNILARPVVVIAESLDVEFVDQTGAVNNERLFEFDNTPKAMEDLQVTYKWDGSGYKAGDKVEEYDVTYLYVGTQSNGVPYVQKTAPVHAGVYAVTAIVTIRDGSAISHAGVGHGVLTITPTESDITVGNKAVKWDGNAHGMSDEIVATSKVAGLTPDTTIISAGLSADLDNVTGLNAINGTINVDMPAWLDALMKKLNILEAGYGDGIKAATFISYVDQIRSAMTELGVEVAAFDEIVDFVQQIPVTTTLTFHDDASYSEIGAYLYVGIVTDSDHYPSIGAGVLVIYPDATEVKLKFEEDWNGNNIFTWQALENMNLEAGAYVNGTYSADATAKVVNLYFGFTDNGEFLLEAVADGESIEDREDFDNGAYTQLAILLDLGKNVYYAEPISRAFLIVPNPAVVEFVDDSGNANADRHFVFDNQPHEMPVRVTINGVEVKNPAVTVRYVGVQTNGALWNSEEAPKHAGCYTVTAIYTQQDAQDRYVTLGSAVGVMVIEPAEATMDVESKVHVYDRGAIAVDSLITATSAVEGLNPDKTVITAAISTDGTFSENLMSAVTGSVNVDFPRWVDEILTAHAPSIYQGMKASEFNAKLVAKLNGVIENAEALAEQYNIPAEELISTLTAAVETVEDILNQMPGDVNLTFTDDVSYSAVGAYLVVGVVTDSDHYPAVDAGVLAIIPDADLVHLKWNYEDENNIWTRELLKKVDLYATAYQDKEYKNPYGEEAVISYRFIGVDSKGALKMYDNAEELPNGIYTEIAFVELKIGSEMVISDVIERTIIIMPNMGGVEIVDDQNRAQNKFEYAYGDKVVLFVTLNGQRVTNDIYYVGVDNHALPYASKTVPSDPGIYMATTVYKVTDDKGNVTNIGTDSAMVTIAPGENDMQVTGSTVTYDGKGHGVSTKDVTVSTGSATNANYTLISGGVNISGDADEIGIQALSGNVNVDFPAWVDDLMKKYDIDLYTEGTTPATIKNFLNARTQEIVDLVPAEELAALGVAEADINAAIDVLTAPYKAIAALLDKLPQNVTLTYEDDMLYTEPGYYGYFGIITDLDEIPSADTGLLVIDKIDYVFGAWHEVVPYDGQEHTVYVPNDEHGPVTTDYVTMIVDRQTNNVNFLLEEDLMYVLEKVEKILNIDLPTEISIAALREKLGSENIDAFADVLVAVLDKVMAGMEVPEDKNMGQTTYGDLLRIREVLTKLPADGTITINGKKPVEVGAYEFYIFAFSDHYKTTDASAVLFIEPIRVVVNDIENSKVYGDADPELKAEVTYYSIQGREDPYTYKGKDLYETDYSPFISAFEDVSLDWIVMEKVEITTLPDDIELTYDVVRVSGEDVGEYAMRIENASIIDSRNYVLEVVEDDTVFTITPLDEDDQKTGFQVIIEDKNDKASATIARSKIVEIDGVEYKLDANGELWITKETAEKWAKEGTKLLTTYVYKEEASDVHKEYPTAMYVWALTYEYGTDNALETVRALRVQELDNYLMYEGTSIRINFVNDAIRFFTSVTPEGYKGLKNGTLLKNTGTVLDGAAMLEMGTRAKKYDAADTSLTIANGAGDIVFGEHANDDGLATDGLRKYGDGTRAVTKEPCYLFTGAMENLPTSKENLNLEFVVRPYVTLKLKNGETVTLYGGKYQRTISYVAYQNQTFMPGTAYNDYIQKIIKISGIDPNTGKIS